MSPFECRVPVLRCEFREVQQLLVVEIVSHKVRLDIENELTAEALRPGPRELGFASLGGSDLEHARTVDLVHGQKGRRHPTAGLHELPAAQAQTLAVIVGQLEDAPFDAFLRVALRRRQKFTIGNNLSWYRCGGGSRFSTCHQALLSFTQPTAHRRSPK